MKANNNQKIREALDKIGNISAFVAENCGNSDTAKYMNDIISIVQEIVAEPPRNCDVGDAKEQAERFFNFCDGYMYATGYKNCGTCPLWTSGCVGHDCELRWAQMPYDEGVAK